MTLLRQPPFETSPDEEIIQQLLAAGRTVLGRDLEMGGGSDWADSALIFQAGIPPILFGPTGDEAHADHEWVSLSATTETAAALIETASQLLHHDGTQPVGNRPWRD